eukprot:3865419-Alexandrium_andersonii.AAC.1
MCIRDSLYGVWMRGRRRFYGARKREAATGPRGSPPEAASQRGLAYQGGTRFGRFGLRRGRFRRS